jgi:hypothetical protein
MVKLAVPMDHPLEGDPLTHIRDYVQKLAICPGIILKPLVTIFLYIYI